MCLLLLFAGWSACTDCMDPINAMVEESSMDSSDCCLQLVDADGNAVTELSPHWDHYYARIGVAGEWWLEGDGGFVVPSITHGQGPEVVPIVIGENWTTTRQGSLRLITNGTSADYTRADSDSTQTKRDSTSIILTQMSNANLQEVKRILTSNKGAGYGYSYNGDYCLGTTLEIFNMSMLDSMQNTLGYHFIDDDYYPHVEQSLVTGYSKEECNNKLAIEASLGVEYNKVNVKVSGNYTSSNKTDSTTQYARSRVSGTMFTREVHHYNILAVAREDSSLYKKLYSPGFRMVLDELKLQLSKAVGNDWSKAPNSRTDSICKVFCEDIGPCLITKSVMGCCLDYSMSIKSSVLGDSMTCGGSLELKIKFATASIEVKGQGQYTNQMNSINNNAEFECSVYGGEVMGVSILSTGGTLTGNEVSVWQQSVLPSTAVLVDMRLAPIYSVIYDEKSQNVLREYVNRKVSAVR